MPTIASDPDQRMQLLASVVFGVAADDFVSDLLSLAPPKDFASGDLAAEARAGSTRRPRSRPHR